MQEFFLTSFALALIFTKKCDLHTLAIYFNSYLSCKVDVGNAKEADFSSFCAMLFIGTLI
jgi:hypothetical protein